MTSPIGTRYYTASAPMDLGTDDETEVEPLERAYTVSDTRYLADIPVRLSKHEEEMTRKRERAAVDHGVDPDVLPVYASVRNLERYALESTASSQQGMRPSHEDAHRIFEILYGTVIVVCDGHGRYSQNRAKKRVPQVGLEVARATAQLAETQLQRCIERHCLNMKPAFEEWAEMVHRQMPTDIAGTTAAVCFIERVTNVLHVANIGDSKVVVFRKHEGVIYPIPMTCVNDWSTPDNVEKVRALLTPEEFEKWIAREPKHRRMPLLGGVNLANSLGDKKMTFKGQVVISHNPTCTQLPLEEDDIVFVACDGYFDFVSLDETVRHVLLPHLANPDTDLAHLATRYALDNGSTDNVTVVATKIQAHAPPLKLQKTATLTI